jgi:hypothetical protein
LVVNKGPGENSEIKLLEQRNRVIQRSSYRYPVNEAARFVAWSLIEGIFGTEFGQDWPNSFAELLGWFSGTCCQICSAVQSGV